jgi:hypothetical protein
MCFLDCPPVWSCRKRSIWVLFGKKVVWKNIWLFTRIYFLGEFLEFQSYSKHKNYFDVSLKQTCSEEIQVIPMDRSP